MTFSLFQPHDLYSALTFTLDFKMSADIPAMDNTLGPVLVGVICTSVYKSSSYTISTHGANHILRRLYGITTMQSINYFQQSSDDSSVLKTAVSIQFPPSFISRVLNSPLRSDLSGMGHHDLCQ